jgi:hypothetical protein
MKRPEGDRTLARTAQLIEWNMEQANDTGEDAIAEELRVALAAVRRARLMIGREEVGD